MRADYTKTEPMASIINHAKEKGERFETITEQAIHKVGHCKVTQQAAKQDKNYANFGE